MKLLLDAGADKEVKDEDGWTPLHVAARKGHTDIVKLLLDAGADKDVKDKDGRRRCILLHGKVTLTL